MTWQSFQTFANFTFAKVVIWLRGSTITASQSCTPASHRQAGRVPRSDPARWACTMETGTGARHRPEGAASKVRSSSGIAVGPDDGTPETLEAPRQNGSGLPGPPPCGCAALQPSGRRSLPRALRSDDHLAPPGTRTSFRDDNDSDATGRQKPRICPGDTGPNTRLSSGNAPSPLRITPRSVFATMRLMTGMPVGLSSLHKFEA